jgi:hypothetical protein
MGANVEKRDRSTGSQFPIAKTDGLNITVQGGNINAANTTVVIASAVVALTDDSINYVYIDWADDTIKANTTGFPKASNELYKVTTVSGAVTQVEDYRAVLRMACHTEYKTKSTWLFSGDENSETGWDNKDVSGDAPPGATGILARVGVTDSGTPGVDTWIAVRKPGETAASQEIKIYPQVSAIWTGAVVPIGLDATKKFQLKCKPGGTMSYVVALCGWIYGGE